MPDGRAQVVAEGAITWAPPLNHSSHFAVLPGLLTRGEVKAVRKVLLCHSMSFLAVKQCAPCSVHRKVSDTLLLFPWPHMVRQASDLRVSCACLCAVWANYIDPVPLNQGRANTGQARVCLGPATLSLKVGLALIATCLGPATLSLKVGLGLIASCCDGDGPGRHTAVQKETSVL